MLNFSKVIYLESFYEQMYITAEQNKSQSVYVFADYHSVDDGDLMTGRPYGYTEEYQSYEQTGTSSVSYWSQYGSGCPRRTYVAGSAAKTYLDQYSNTTCPNLTNRYPAAGLGGSSGHKSTCTAYVNSYMCNRGCNMTPFQINYNKCSVCGGGDYDSNANCRQYNTCTIQYSAGSSSYYKCTYSGGTCSSSSCPYTYTSTPTYGYVTRTRTTTYDKESGLFSEGLGAPYAARNLNILSTRAGHADYHTNAEVVYGEIITQYLVCGGWTDKPELGLYPSIHGIFLTNRPAGSQITSGDVQFGTRVNMRIIIGLMGQLVHYTI